MSKIKLLLGDNNIMLYLNIGAQSYGMTVHHKRIEVRFNGKTKMRKINVS